MQAFSDEANELLPIFNKTSSRFYKAAVPTGVDWSNQVKKPKKHSGIQTSNNKHTTNNNNDHNNNNVITIMAT